MVSTESSLLGLPASFHFLQFWLCPSSFSFLLLVFTLLNFCHHLLCSSFLHSPFFVLCLSPLHDFFSSLPSNYLIIHILLCLNFPLHPSLFLSSIRVFLFFTRYFLFPFRHPHLILLRSAVPTSTSPSSPAPLPSRAVSGSCNMIFLLFPTEWPRRYGWGCFQAHVSKRLHFCFLFTLHLNDSAPWFLRVCRPLGRELPSLILEVPSLLYLLLEVN